MVVYQSGDLVIKVPTEFSFQFTELVGGFFVLEYNHTVLGTSIIESTRYSLKSELF